MLVVQKVSDATTSGWRVFLSERTVRGLRLWAHVNSLRRYENTDSEAEHDHAGNGGAARFVEEVASMRSRALERCERQEADEEKTTWLWQWIRHVGAPGGRDMGGRWPLWFGRSSHDDYCASSGHP